MIGLNLRMTEVTASIACAQLAKASRIIQTRIELAETLTDMVKDIPWIRAQKADKDCVHVYYKWAALVDGGRREGFVRFLNLWGFPMEAGYSKPLHRVFNDPVDLPVVQRVEYQQIITFEICAWSPLPRHIKRMRELINQAAEP